MSKQLFEYSENLDPEKPISEDEMNKKITEIEKCLKIDRLDRPASLKYVVEIIENCSNSLANLKAHDSTKFAKCIKDQKEILNQLLEEMKLVKEAGLLEKDSTKVQQFGQQRVTQDLKLTYRLNDIDWKHTNYLIEEITNSNVEDANSIIYQGSCRDHNLEELKKELNEKDAAFIDELYKSDEESPSLVLNNIPMLKEKLENAYDAYEYLTTDEKTYEDEHRIQNSLGILRAQKEFAENNQDFVPEELERDDEGKLVEYYTNDNNEEVRAADHLEEIKSKDDQLQEERNEALIDIAEEARNAEGIATEAEKGSEEANAAIIASAAFMTDHGAAPTSTQKGDSSIQSDIPEETMKKAQSFYEKMVNWWEGFSGNLKDTLTLISNKRTRYLKRFHFKGNTIAGQATNNGYRNHLSDKQAEARGKMLASLKE